LQNRINATYLRPYEGEDVSKERIYWDDDIILLRGQISTQTIPKETIPSDKKIITSPSSSDIPIDQEDEWADESNIEIVESIEVYSPETIKALSTIEIPFEFCLPPCIDGIPSLHPSFKIVNPVLVSFYNAYDLLLIFRSCQLYLKASVFETNHPTLPKSGLYHSLFYRPKTRHVSIIVPTKIFDPRLYTRIVLAEPKNWHSAPETQPCEWDINLEQSIIGPGDDLRLTYRIAVSSIDQAFGVRVKSFRVVLKETDVVGDSFKWIVKGVTEIATWEKKEYNAKSKKKELPAEESRGKLLNEHLRGRTEANGVYCEDTCVIKVTQEFQPSTPKMGCAPRTSLFI
jgi:hypothetical protein